jgi:hypothetical protein
MAWVKRNVGGLDVVWREQIAGFAIEGRWMGAREGQFKDAPVGTIQTDGGPVTFGMPTVLRDEMAGLDVWTRVRITYRGTGTTRTGKEAHRFDVETDDETDAETAPTAPVEAEADVPF